MHVITLTIGQKRGIKSIIISLVAAVGVHFFCYLPLLLGLVGLGNVQLAGELAVLRPVFYIISLSAMLLANWFTFKRSTSTGHKTIMLITDLIVIVLLYNNFLKHNIIN